MSEFSESESEQVQQANDSGRTPVVFIHGLWLLPTSWDRWRGVFEDAGYTTFAPGWPDDPETVDEANAQARGLGQQDRRPGGRPLRGHRARAGKKARSHRALLRRTADADSWPGEASRSATVAIDAAPFRGVLPLPFSALKSAWPVLNNPANQSRAIPLTFDQFRFGFANAVSEDEARDLYKTFAVPAPGAPLFQAAAANLNPWTEAKVDIENPGRGPLLVISGEKDNTVPRAIAHATFKAQQRNPGSPSSPRYPTAGMRSPSTAAGVRWPTRRSDS